ncbi:DUF4424 domain-containing protein [Sphingomonas sp. PL-96]|uniref:DUF4424 domain-containing protein n=1 Tax=Sphingomonas sp. PL-96 TaxID=2887201 RepID=UPI001E4B9511|nr:DUF4424 domain-containing protein [Sphingomonas sp. PL-96]MCC2976406.1 DUF4424 domain-containing protein [Sphingomonas sp. PL-96]
MPVLALALAAIPADANDSTAQLAAGGLVLTRNDTIEMQSEDLYISREAVRVRYRFLNSSGRDATVRVAFPMPDIGGPDFFVGDVSIPVDAPANILGFTTLVDGKPVKMEVEQKAMVGDVDRSAWLIANHVPLAVHLDAADAAIARLPADKRAEAARLGLIDAAGEPLWVLRTTYHWLQTFPAGRPVTIEHRYTPSVGGTVMTGIGQDWDTDTARSYCVEQPILRSVARSAKGGDGPRYAENWVDYILVTGSNWKKPIGDFRLVVDKGAPTTLVSFCGKGVTKTGATTFEMRKRNWRPEQDLSILFLTPYDAD